MPRSGNECWSWPTHGPVSGCSSWPAVRRGSGSAAAQRVLPGGVVVVSDFVAEMTTIAATRAAAMGAVNVEARLLDVEAIAEPDSSYDVVLCREGLMFATDPARAGAEIARVLRPGGRVAIAVWGPRSRNPWLGLVLDVVSAQVGRPVPPPGLPGPFALEDAERLADLLSGAGLSDVSVGEVAAPLRAASFDEWWTRTAALAGPVSQLLSALPADAPATGPPPRTRRGPSVPHRRRTRLPWGQPRRLGAPTLTRSCGSSNPTHARPRCSPASRS